MELDLEAVPEPDFDRIGWMNRLVNRLVSRLGHLLLAHLPRRRERALLGVVHSLGQSEPIHIVECWAGRQAPLDSVGVVDIPQHKANIAHMTFQCRLRHLAYPCRLDAFGNRVHCRASHMREADRYRAERMGIVEWSQFRSSSANNGCMRSRAGILRIAIDSDQRRLVAGPWSVVHQGSQHDADNHSFELVHVGSRQKRGHLDMLGVLPHQSPGHIHNNNRNSLHVDIVDLASHLHCGTIVEPFGLRAVQKLIRRRKVELPGHKTRHKLDTSSSSRSVKMELIY